jgi:FOG: PKD repeat
MGGYGDRPYGNSPYKDEGGVDFDFEGTPVSGSSPLSVQFSPLFSSSFTDTIIAYLWDFGDGVTSEDQTPLHTYTTPGSYDVSLTIYNEYYWTTVTKEDYIAVASPAGSTLVSRCLRFATEPTEGEGWSEYGNTDFVVPVDLGAYVIQDDNDVSRCIVEDEDANIYEQGTFDRINFLKPSFVDKADMDGTGGTEISGQKWQCEETAGTGNENKRVLDQKTWIQVRPNDPDYRSLAGYTVSGLRIAQKMGQDVYVDGEKVLPEAQAADIPENGEVVFVGNNIEGHRIQYVTNFAASEFKITEVKHEILVKDASGTLTEKTMTEYAYQLEMETGKLLHIARGKDLLFDRVSKQDAVGNNISAIVGPDGLAGSALRADSLTLPALDYSSGECFLMFWSTTNDTETNTGNVQPNIYTPAGGVPLSSASLFTMTIPANAPDKIILSVEYGSVTLGDIRIYSTARSAGAIANYYRNVAVNQGISYLPSFI